VIKNIEGLRPKLQIPSLVEADLLEQRGIECGQARPNKLIAPRIPEGPGNRQQKGIGIEPPVGSTENHWSAKGGIPVGHVGGERCRLSRNGLSQQ